MKTETYTTMDVGELEALAHKHFNIQYDFAAEEETSNDTQKSYCIDQRYIDEFSWEDWAAFLEGTRRQFLVRLLLTRLVMLGKIPAGNILIDCSW
jgi:hypothetical protein